MFSQEHTPFLRNYIDNRQKNDIYVHKMCTTNVISEQPENPLQC